MIPYLILVATSIAVGFVAVCLYRRKDAADPKIIFIAAGLLNAGAFLALLWRERRRRP